MIEHEYADYNAYLTHQKQKTLKLAGQSKLKGYEIRVGVFRTLFEQHVNIIRSSERGLCVCARQGHEVVALRELGMRFVIGVDLVACVPHVEEGDMHHLAYPDASFDFVFSNAFDHSLYPEMFIAEVERVLQPGGHCLLHLLVKPRAVDQYAENVIRDVADVAQFFKHSQRVKAPEFQKVKGQSLNAHLLMKRT